MANKKTKKSKKDNKNAIVGGICAAVVVVAIIIVAVVLATRGGLSDDYFKSDDTKYVLSIESEMTGNEEQDALTPVKTHVVYLYSGDSITGMKSYAEYNNADQAKNAYNTLKEAVAAHGDDEEASADMDLANYQVNGKYLIYTFGEDEYKDLVAELDVFHKDLDGLIVVEVEFAAIDDANSFNPPEWFGADVTMDGKYHNSYLSSAKDIAELLQ